MRKSIDIPFFFLFFLFGITGASVFPGSLQETSVLLQSLAFFVIALLFLWTTLRKPTCFLVIAGQIMIFVGIFLILLPFFQNGKWLLESNILPNLAVITAGIYLSGKNLCTSKQPKQSRGV